MLGTGTMIRVNDATGRYRQLGLGPNPLGRGRAKPSERGNVAARGEPFQGFADGLQ
jgi:hypothetical protein